MVKVKCWRCRRAWHIDLSHSRTVPGKDRLCTNCEHWWQYHTDEVMRQKIIYRMAVRQRRQMAMPHSFRMGVAFDLAYEDLAEHWDEVGLDTPYKPEDPAKGEDSDGLTYPG